VGHDKRKVKTLRKHVVPAEQAQDAGEEAIEDEAHPEGEEEHEDKSDPDDEKQRIGNPFEINFGNLSEPEDTETE
jgi:hypothetical protein